MHIIYDDIIYSLQKSGGGSVYWTELMKRIKDNVEHYVYESAVDNFFYEENNLPNLHKLSSKLLFVKRYKNLKLSSLEEPFIFHSSLYRLCNNKYAINITTVHDFTYEYFRKDLKSNFHKWQKKNAILHSNGVICISENTKKDLLKFYPQFNGKLKVIYNGYSTDKYYFKPDVQHTHNILFVGARFNYKRFDVVVLIVSELKDCRLIIIGGGDLNANEKSLLDSKLKGRYEKKGYISDEELCNLYNSAFFLLYPSEYEGFGIPIVEAQACGCPVVCQKKSSVPEVAGDSGVYIDSSDIDSALKTIRMLYNETYYSQIQQFGLSNVKRFSWDKCANEVESFYKELYTNVTQS